MATPATLLSAAMRLSSFALAASGALLLASLLTPERALAQAPAQSPAATPAATPAAAPALPPLVRAPTDQAQFRRFTLDNGLRVLLMSDPKLNKSGAALAVQVGQIDDPADSEGLAHFLEHMLFLGTDKYPDEAEYTRFMRANGGYNNAYTASDHTNYQFEVRHEALPEALDRFAQFFIAPRFNPDFTAREVTAVHNEAMRHVQNDLRRQISVLRELYVPGSGESKFSTGNRDTLARATPAAVRAFYERHYSAERMALSIVGRASLDELEKLARAQFAPVPRRALPPLTARQPTFQPRKPALRMAYVEPIKELRQLRLDFVVPPTRPHFASRPDRLLDELLSDAGPGGLLAKLKGEGLANSVNAGLWERTADYSSLIVSIDLTPEGERRHARVMALVFGYLDHLRKSPFPAALYDDLARIGRLQETYVNRGDGADLATRLANQALFYPLAVAERADTVWGAPDEAAYRAMLAALVPDNMIAMLTAKGVPTDKRERIYNVAYSYREEAGEAYTALQRPVAGVSFALPGANRYLPATTPLLPEQALKLIDEPGLALHYAPDTEFQRPQTAVVLRFVPVRDIAGPDNTISNAALMGLWSRALSDGLDAEFTAARRAGVAIGSDLTFEGLKISATGYGDSSARFLRELAGRMKSFSISPERFAAIKEQVLRGLQSYEQTEAWQLARERRNALAREHYPLPDQLIAPTRSASWPEVERFGRQMLARGKLEVVVHGHMAPADAAQLGRELAATIAARTAAPEALLRRRHLVIAPGEDVVDRGAIAGVNSAYVADYLVNDETPRGLAAGMLAAALISPTYYSELRTRQQLGYIVGAGLGSSLRQRFLSFTIQSTDHGPDELRRRSEALIATLPAKAGAVGAAEWETLKAGVRSQLEEKPKSIGERAERFFSIAYDDQSNWARREQALAALQALTPADLQALLATTLDPATARRRTVLLVESRQVAAQSGPASFTDRDGWKRTREFR